MSDMKAAHTFCKELWQFYKHNAEVDPVDFEKVVAEGEQLIKKYPEKLQREMIQIVCEMIEAVDLERKESA